MWDRCICPWASAPPSCAVVTSSVTCLTAWFPSPISPPANGNTRTCPRHGAVKDTRHPFLLRPRAQHEAGSGDSSEVHAEGGLSRSVPGESRPSLGSSRARAAQRAARRAASEGVRAAAGRRAGPSHGRGPSCTGQAEGGEQQPWRTESGWRALCHAAPVPRSSPFRACGSSRVSAKHRHTCTHKHAQMGVHTDAHAWARTRACTDAQGAHTHGSARCRRQHTDVSVGGAVRPPGLSRSLPLPLLPGHEPGSMTLALTKWAEGRKVRAHLKP